VASGQLDLGNPAVGAAMLGIQLANDASMKLAAVGVRILAVQEMSINAAGGSTHDSTTVAPAIQVTSATEEQQLYTGEMPPDPLTATKNAFADALDPRKIGVRVRGRDGAAVSVSASGIKVDKDSVKDAVKRKVSRKIFGCVLSLVMLAVVAGILGVVAVFVIWVVYTSM
jgi:hypothetical protein